MQFFRSYFAILGIILGICIIGYGLYVGIVLMLIGGIVDIINQIKAETTSATMVAYAIAKIMFAEFVCGLIVIVGGCVSAFSGFALAESVMKSKQ